MPGREILSKVVIFGLVAAALVATGVWMLLNNVGNNDFVGVWLWDLPALTIIGLGALVAGFGVVVLLGSRWDANKEHEAHEVHITPRDGAPSLPPAWGMGDVGRPGHLPNGGGVAKVVSLNMVHWDVPVVLIGLLVWTAVAVMFLAPR